MFEERMVTSAIPQRVYELCLAIKDKHRKESDLRELLEPAENNKQQDYFGTVKNAAQQLGLISFKEGDISLAVNIQEICSYEALRCYIIRNIDLINNGLFFKVSKEYILLNEKIYKYKSVSDAGLVEYMSKKLNTPVYEADMLAWRFWASFLGLGHLHEMLLLPNMYQYLKSMFNTIDLKKGEEYSFTEFISIILPYAEICLIGLESDNKLNMAISNGLRALHDEGIIQLSHRLDSGDMWFLYESELHTVKSTVSHITIRR